MNYLIQILDILVWPAVILTLALLFRVQLTALIERINTIKHGNTEINLNEKLKSIVEKGDTAEPRKEIALEEDGDGQLIDNLLDVDPLSAILVAWVEFNRIGREILGIDFKSSNATHLISGLKKKEYISAHDSEILNMIRGIRNDAAHLRSSEIDINTASKVCVLLQQIISELKMKA
jgi:hypothetical protein